MYVTVGRQPIRIVEDVKFLSRLGRAPYRTRGRFKRPEDEAEVVALFRKALEFNRSAERSTGTR